MDSYKSRISDGILIGSGTKTKPYEPMSQIACISVSNVFVLNVHIPAYIGSRGKPFFRNSKFFVVVSADRRLQ
jgi:hypothetical protein